MPSRCRSTLICGEADRAVFEPLGYREESAKPLSVDGENIAGAILMVEEQAPGGHYDELTRLKEVRSLSPTAPARVPLKTACWCRTTVTGDMSRRCLKAGIQRCA
jgi:hypothetical protein